MITFWLNIMPLLMASTLVFSLLARDWRLPWAMADLLAALLAAAMIWDGSSWWGLAGIPIAFRWTHREYQYGPVYERRSLNMLRVGFGSVRHVSLRILSAYVGLLGCYGATIAYPSWGLGSFPAPVPGSEARLIYLACYWVGSILLLGVMAGVRYVLIAREGWRDEAL